MMTRACRDCRSAKLPSIFSVAVPLTRDKRGCVVQCCKEPKKSEEVWPDDVCEEWEPWCKAGLEAEICAINRRWREVDAKKEGATDEAP